VSHAERRPLLRHRLRGAHRRHRRSDRRRGSARGGHQGPWRRRRRRLPGLLRAQQLGWPEPGQAHTTDSTRPRVLGVVYGTTTAAGAAAIGAVQRLGKGTRPPPVSRLRARATAPPPTLPPARACPSSVFLDKNRRDIGKSQSIWTNSKMGTPGSPRDGAHPRRAARRARAAVVDLVQRAPELSALHRGRGRGGEVTGPTEALLSRRLRTLRFASSGVSATVLTT
jgi:hypothetical protein